MVPEDLRYHKEHEWVRIEGERAIIGISDFAQEALGDIVFLEIPSVGRIVKEGEEITEIESTKTTSFLFAPLRGKLVAVNETLETKPELMNEDPYGEGWVVVIEMEKPDEIIQLMSAKEYERFLSDENS